MIKDKDGIRDYATMAFRQAARLGFPTAHAYENELRERVQSEMQNVDPQEVLQSCEAVIHKHASLLSDIKAVERVFETLEEQGKVYMADAVKAVYCVRLNDKIRRNDITYRVRAFARENYVAEMTVYRWLKTVRLLFAKYRVLTVTEETGDK